MEKKDIRFLKIQPLRGPNIWTYRPVIEAWVDIGVLEEYPSNTLPGFYERLSALLPSLVEHRCSVGERGGFLKRVKEGTWAAHILEHVTLELQNLAGQRTGFGKARETSQRGVYKVVVRSRQEEVTRACLEAARELILAAIEDTPFDVAATVEHLKDIADTYCLGPSTENIVAAATERHIPFIRLTSGNLVQLGYGVKSRRIWTAETDRTSAIAEGISRDKELTKNLLKSCGVPIPEGYLAHSPDEAWEAAEDIGVPVVVKPRDGNHGRGVSTDLKTREEVIAAYHVAEKEGSGVLVERFIPGNEHRLLVVGGKLVAAARGEEAWITGDGRSTIVQLIDSQINTDPRRGTTEDYPLNVIRVDDDPAVRLELARQGVTPGTVPPEGQRVLIQRNGNVAFDITGQVHPAVAAMASLAARVVGLDIAGIDVVAEDISRPLEAQNGAVVEVNAGPGLLMHIKPAEGTPRPVGQAIVDHLFPHGDDGRIPIVGITGSHGTTAVARLVARLIHLGGAQVGLACRDGLYTGCRQVEKHDSANWAAARKVLLNRSVETAVFENGSRAIVAEGLAYDRCHVAVVTSMDENALLPEYHIDSPEKLFSVLRTQVDIVPSDGVAVLNASDPHVAGMAELCDGDVIFFAPEESAPVLAQHRAQGKRVVFARNGQLVLATGQDEILLTAFPSVESNRFPIESFLAAAGAAWALGISLGLIRAGIETFDMAEAKGNS